MSGNPEAVAAPLEGATQQEILLAAPELGLRLFRNNVGSLQDRTGQWVTYGIGHNVGGSDTIGYEIGTGRFCAIEAKRKGEGATKDQILFVWAVKRAGGIAGVVYSVEEFRELVLASRTGPAYRHW